MRTQDPLKSLLKVAGKGYAWTGIFIRGET